MSNIALKILDFRHSLAKRCTHEVSLWSVKPWRFEFRVLVNEAVDPDITSDKITVHFFDQLHLVIPHIWWAITLLDDVIILIWDFSLCLVIKQKLL